jgi:hypothetical protein
VLNITHSLSIYDDDDDDDVKLSHQCVSLIASLLAATGTIDKVDFVHDYVLGRSLESFIKNQL